MILYGKLLVQTHSVKKSHFVIIFKKCPICNKTHFATKKVPICKNDFRNAFLLAKWFRAYCFMEFLWAVVTTAPWEKLGLWAKIFLFLLGFWPKTWKLGGPLWKRARTTQKSLKYALIWFPKSYYKLGLLLLQKGFFTTNWDFFYYKLGTFFRLLQNGTVL